jgi:two-component system LytT family response regulator
MINAILVDDEKYDLVKLRTTLDRYCPQVNVIAEASNAEQAIEVIGKNTPDLVFLDIQMPGKTGFDLLAELPEYPFDVVFVTAFDQYAIQAIRCAALDYLLKPVKPASLVAAVQRAANKLHTRNSQEQIHELLNRLKSGPTASGRICLPTLKEILFVSPSDIIRCESSYNYTKVFLNNGETILVSKTMSEIEPVLLPYHFIRCHQSHLVNRQFIKSMKREDNISELVLLNKCLVPVSRQKRDFVKSEMLK